MVKLEGDRTVYGFELSPAYCEVILRRFESLTGEVARLVGHLPKHMLKTFHPNKRKNKGKLNDLVPDGNDGKISMGILMVLASNLTPSSI